MGEGREKLATLEEIREASFDEFAIPYYQLVLGFYEKALVGLVYDPYEKRYPLLKSFELPSLYWEKLSAEKILGEPLFRKSFQQISVLVASSETTLVPSPFFREDLLKHYYQLNFKHEAGKKVFFNYIKAIDAYLVFALDASFWNSVQSFLNVEKPLHVATPWLESLLKKLHLKKDPMLAADVDQAQVRIALVKDGSLEFFNTFRYQSNEDLLYHLLNTAHQFGLDPEKDEVSLSGTIEKGSKRFELLKRYMRHINLLDGFKNHQPGPELRKIPRQRHYHLYGTPLCEL